MIQLMTKTINGNGIKHEALIKGTKELLTANNWLIANKLASFESQVIIERLDFLVILNHDNKNNIKSLK